MTQLLCLWDACWFDISINNAVCAHLGQESELYGAFPGTCHCFSNKTALAMIFKLAQAAEKSWHRLRGYDQLPIHAAANTAQRAFLATLFWWIPFTQR